MTDIELPSIGGPAPPFEIRRAGDPAISLREFDGRPVVLLFLPRASLPPSIETGGALAGVRAELRGLGAVLIAISPDGAWAFSADDQIEWLAHPGELDADDVAATFAAYRVPTAGAVTLFVVDERSRVRFSHATSDAGAWLAAVTAALGNAGRGLLAGAPGPRLSRRELVVGALVAGFTVVFLDGDRARAASPAAGAAKEIVSGDKEITLQVNGAARKVRIEPRVTLLDALRERLGLTGSKKGCDHGQCGACTVWVDGRRVSSCLTLALAVEGAAITTIEGLSERSGEVQAPSGVLGAMQRAFAAEDALQCGYCTPGQIMSALAMLREGHAVTDDEVREQMSGNLCRCGAYCNIVAAIQTARKEV